MPKEAVEIDEEHQFTGVTVKVISVSKIKSEIDGGEIYVQIKCHDKAIQTKIKLNDRETVLFDENFFYNTTEVLDDDISFELYCIHNGEGTSKNLTSSSKLDKSISKMNFNEGKLLGATTEIQVSRMKRQKQERALDLHSEDNKVIGKILVSFEYLERQDIVGGIKCPNLSLKADRNIKSPLTLENKYTSFKNLYSFLDGNVTPNC